MAPTSPLRLTRPGNRISHPAVVLSVSLVLWCGCSGGAAPDAETASTGETPAAATATTDAHASDEHAAEAMMAATEGAAAKDKAEPEPPGEAPFDTTYLDVDTELFVFAKLSEILNSSLVQMLSGGNLGPLNELEQQLGINPRDVSSVTLGVGNLAEVSGKAAEAMNMLNPGAGMGAPFGPGMTSDSPNGFDTDPAMSADAETSDDLLSLSADPESGETTTSGQPAAASSATQKVVAVIRTSAPINVENLEQEHLERLPHGNSAYYRTGPQPGGDRACLFLADKSTLVVADEPTIKQIIETGADRPRPTADLGFVKALPHLLVALAPKDKSALLGGQPSSKGSGNVSNQYGSPPSVDPSTGESTDPSAEYERQMAEQYRQQGNRGGQPAVPPMQFDSKLIEEHAEALALLVDLTSGIGLNVAIRCDSAESADQVHSAVDTALAQLRQQFDANKSSLPGMIQQIVQPLLDSLEAETDEAVVSVSTSLPEEQQSSLAMLPMALMGMMMSGGMEVEGNLEMMASRRALAQEVVDQGQPAANADELPEGLQLKALARWGESRYGDQAPNPLEIGIVASQGPAANAIGFGKLELSDARASAESPLKWIGTTTGSFDSDPIRGFVPIDRDGMFSSHPDDGIATGLLLEAPAETVTELERVAGQLILRVAGQTEEVLVTDLSRLRGGVVDDERLADAQMKVDATAAAQGQVEVSWNESPLLGKVELLTAEGTPVETIGTGWTTSGGRRSMTFSLAGPAPDNIAVRVETYTNLEEVAVPFRFENLPLPEPQELNEQQQALLVWTRGESPADHPDLVIEAQGRWRTLEPVIAPQMPLAGNQFEFMSDGTEDIDLDFSDMTDEEMSEAYRLQQSGQYSGRGPSGGSGDPPQTARSEQPLQVLLDLTGPLALAAEAIGGVDITSVRTDIDTDLAFESAEISGGYGDPVGEFVDLTSERAPGADSPLGGLRLIVKLTPPNQAIRGITQLNGTLTLRTVRERTEAILSNLQSRVGQPEGNPPIAQKQVTERELIKFGLKPAVAIEPNRVMMRLIDGKDERISDVSLLDLNGLPLTNVNATVREGTGNARGRKVYSFEFPDGVPQKIGMKISVNMGVKDVEIPIRIRDMPLPPLPPDAA